MLRSSALLLAMLAVAAVQAADTPTFESLDKNTDGRISLDEASTHDALFTAFKSLDADRDGQLTKEEFGKYRAG
jgi:Ca2+-binding EF-hand superfamily protein